MGLYRYISEEETKQMKTVQDPELNELLQEALEYDNTILVEEDNKRRKLKKGYRGWFFRETEEKYLNYRVMHESRSADGSAYQANYILGVSGVEVVYAYLYGIINGAGAAHRIIEENIGVEK